jgi:hypothetical protein
VCIGREAVNHDKDAKHSLSEFNRPPANHLLSPGINLGTNVAMVTCGIATHNEREPLGFFVAGVDLQWRLVGACTVGQPQPPAIIQLQQNISVPSSPDAGHSASTDRIDGLSAARQKMQRNRKSGPTRRTTRHQVLPRFCETS